MIFEKPIICVPIIEKNSESVLQSAKKAIALGADMLEFRIDALEEPDADEVQKLIVDINHPVIATNRTRNEGGFFNGTEDERTSILIKAAKYADIVDIELQTDEKLRGEVIKASKFTIVSYHDFKKTPSFEELLDVVKKEKKIGDIAKFAVMPNSTKDTLTVLKVLSEVQNTIGIAMGDIGKYTRVVAPIFGSPITFASVGNGSAPGQLDIKTTKDILMKLTVID